MPSGGAALQLIAKGQQDLYLTGSPQITFFRQVYRRYTNFANESLRIPVTGNVDFGQLVSVEVPRLADLLGALTLELDLPALVPDPGPSPPNLSYVNGIGFAMIEYVSVMLGQQEIDRQTGEWLYARMQLTTPGAKQLGIYNMVSYMSAYSDQSAPGPLHLYVPLDFWFCRSPGLALPLLALQKTPVRLYIKFRPASAMVFSDAMEGSGNGCVYAPQNLPSITSLTLWGEFYFLDTDEQRRFVANDHEYLITTVQRQPSQSIPAAVTLANVDLVFNGPISEIVWLVQEDRTKAANEPFNYSNLQLTETGYQGDLIESAVLRVDGYTRFEDRSAQYFRLVVPWLRHTCVPNDFIYCYSFSLAPEADQPMGSLNASAVNSLVLSLTMTSNDAATNAQNGVPLTAHNDCSVTVYAFGYNVLRITQGLGGAVFQV
jgi:hypothetical protein